MLSVQEYSAAKSIAVFKLVQASAHEEPLLAPVAAMST